MQKLVVRRQTSVSFATSNSLRSIVVMDKTAPEDESQRTCLRPRTNGRRRSEPGDLEAIDGRAAFTRFLDFARRVALPQ